MILRKLDPSNSFEREAVVWRWKGHPSDIVRIAGGVIEAAGPGPVSLAVSDALGLTQFAELLHLDAGHLPRRRAPVVAHGGESEEGAVLVPAAFTTCSRLTV